MVSDCGAGCHPPEPETWLLPVLVLVLLTSLVSITFPSSSSTIQPTVSQRWPRSVPLAPRALLRDPLVRTARGIATVMLWPKTRLVGRVGSRPVSLSHAVFPCTFVVFMMMHAACRAACVQYS
jgi:hypothetical protein